MSAAVRRRSREFVQKKRRFDEPGGLAMYNKNVRLYETGNNDVAVRRDRGLRRPPVRARDNWLRVSLDRRGTVLNIFVDESQYGYVIVVFR